MVKMEVKKLVYNEGRIIDKGVLGFLCDVLYLKEVINIEEFEDIMSCSSCCDLDDVFESMMMDEYRDYGRGDMEWEMKNGIMERY